MQASLREIAVVVVVVCFDVLLFVLLMGFFVDGQEVIFVLSTFWRLVRHGLGPMAWR